MGLAPGTIAPVAIQAISQAPSQVLPSAYLVLVVFTLPQVPVLARSARQVVAMLTQILLRSAPLVQLADTHQLGLTQRVPQAASTARPAGRTPQVRTLTRTVLCVTKASIHWPDKRHASTARQAHLTTSQEGTASARFVLRDITLPLKLLPALSVLRARLTTTEGQAHRV